jgi:hypothetical protein
LAVFALDKTLQQELVDKAQFSRWQSGTGRAVGQSSPDDDGQMRQRCAGALDAAPARL